jgi:hypothetical protein
MEDGVRMPALSPWAPAPLLLHPDLFATAKLVWLICLLHPDLDLTRHPGAVANRAGLTTPTVLTARARLAQAGWAPEASGRRHRQGGPGAHLPARLLNDRDLSASARILYGQLQLLPAGVTEVTYATLAQTIGQTAFTARRGTKELTAAGWVSIKQPHRCAPIHFTLTDPDAHRQEADVLMVRQRLEEHEFRGEALMREFLSVLVDSEQFSDNVAPHFLFNPLTDALMQFDRYYSPSIAFEFNGPQHYQRTKRYASMKLSNQRSRDLMKKGLCIEQGVTLVVVHREDLSLAGMQAKIGNLLPLRKLEGQERVIDLLEASSLAHRSTDAPGIKSQAAGPQTDSGPPPVPKPSPELGR